MLLLVQLRGMLVQMKVFGDAGGIPNNDVAGWKAALATAHSEFKDWQRMMKIRSSQKMFKPKMLIREGYGFYLNAKGYNARVIAEWLLDKLINVNTNPSPDYVPDDRANLCEVAMTPGWVYHLSLLLFYFGIGLEYFQATSLICQEVLVEYTLGI